MGPVAAEPISDDELGCRAADVADRLRDRIDDQFEFRGAQFDAGLAMVHFPEGLGGLGLSRSRQAVVDAVLRSRGVRYEDLRINPIGIGMGSLF